MIKMIYQVSGWDGATSAYTSKERALKELERRAGLADRAILVERFEDEREIYLLYEGKFTFFGDEKLYLTLETVPLYE
jgi:hypothetical protein